MTNLKKLNVSLTKHGAHKVAALLKKFETDEVLNHLWNSERGINIETAQAKKTLSVNGKGVVPVVWDKAKALGNEAIDALVLIAIIFSHHQLIAAMQKATNKRPFAGTINRGETLDGKAFTNFAHIIEELGYSTKHSVAHVDFDLQKLFRIEGLNALVVELLTNRLTLAGWDRKRPFIDEATALNFHEAFSMTEAQFRTWLSTGALEDPELDFEDEDFFLNADDKPTSGKFVFKAGHNEKKTGSVPVAAPKLPTKANLLHNEIQNSLVAALVEKFGKAHVGTENDTGDGTSIDVVVKTEKNCTFYEIKTASSVKACIRQAIPQLLEYAYWHGSADRADALVIVSRHPLTKEADTYLGFLRTQFGLKIYYEQHEIAKARP